LEKINLKTPKINSCQAVYSNYNEPILSAFRNNELVRVSLYVGLSDGKFLQYLFQGQDHQAREMHLFDHPISLLRMHSNHEILILTQDAVIHIWNLQKSQTVQVIELVNMQVVLKSLEINCIQSKNQN
jgi:hypothetical protein